MKSVTAAIENQIKVFQEEMRNTTSTTLTVIIEKIIVGLETLDLKNQTFANGFNDLISVYYLLTKQDAKYLEGDEIYYIPPEKVKIIDSKLEFECLAGAPSISIGEIEENILAMAKEYKFDENTWKTILDGWKNMHAIVHDGDFVKLFRTKKDEYILWIHPEILTD